MISAIHEIFDSNIANKIISYMRQSILLHLVEGLVVVLVRGVV